MQLKFLVLKMLYILQTKLNIIMNDAKTLMVNLKLIWHNLLINLKLIKIFVYSMEFKCCQSNSCTEKYFEEFLEDINKQSSSALMNIHFLMIFMLSFIARILS